MREATRRTFIFHSKIDIFIPMDPKRVIIYFLAANANVNEMLTSTNKRIDMVKIHSFQILSQNGAYKRLQAVKRSFVQKTVFSRVSSEISVGVQFRGKGSWIRRVRAPIQRLFL